MASLINSLRALKGDSVPPLTSPTTAATEPPAKRSRTDAPPTTDPSGGASMEVDAADQVRAVSLSLSQPRSPCVVNM